VKNKSVQILISRYQTFNPEVTLFEEIEDMTPVKIYLPDPPSYRKIDGYNLSTSKQKFRKRNLPTELKRLERMSAEDRANRLTLKDQKFIEEEWHKRLNGYWFMNHGVPTYIPGDHYTMLNWWNIDIGSPDYRDKDRRWYLHWNKCVADENCYGMLEMTKRRDGKSVRAGFVLYERTSRMLNSFGGIQSKTESDAGSLFQRAVVKGWKQHPRFGRQ